MSLKDYPTNIKPFVFHGLDLELDNNQYQGECPFCTKEDHFFINPKTGQWKCQKCSEAGNITSFLQKLHALAVECTNEDNLLELSEDRSCTIHAIQEWGICISPLTQNPLIPTYNRDGKIVNLSQYISGSKGKRVYGTPTCNTGLFGLNKLGTRKCTIWLVEGIWDAIVLDVAITEVQKNGKDYKGVHTVLAVPGVGSFKAEWSEHFKKSKVNIIFDNDHPKEDGKQPGYDGTMRTAGMLSAYASSLHLMLWGEKGFNSKLADGYDVRDLIDEKASTASLKYIKSHLEKAPDDIEDFSELEKIDPIERTTFNQLLQDYEEALYITGALRDTLITMLACIISTDLSGDQLWIRVIGPPGSGKSTLAEAISAARDYIIARSTFTGLHSGFTAGMDGKDASIINKLRGKTMVVKDADTLMSHPNKEKAFSELRDLYDGTSRAQYLNSPNAKIYENVKCTFILCGTDTLRSNKDSHLGERFLDVDCLDSNADTHPYLERAASNTYQSILSNFSDNGSATDNDEDSKESNKLPSSNMLNIKQTTAGYIIFLKESLKGSSAPTISTRTLATIIKLAKFLSHLRANLPSSRKNKEPTYKPRVELATRLSGQLTKLSICVAIVLNKSRVDDEVLTVTRKIVYDSSLYYHYQVVEAITLTDTPGLSFKQLAYQIHLSESHTTRIVKQMYRLGILTRKSVPNNSGSKGRDVHLWKLSSMMLPLVKAMKI